MSLVFDWVIGLVVVGESCVSDGMAFLFVLIFAGVGKVLIPYKMAISQNWENVM